MKYKCPICKSDHLEITVTCWAELIQTGDGYFETDTSSTDDGSHEWDESSMMACRSCGHVGKSESFEKKARKARTSNA